MTQPYSAVPLMLVLLLVALVVVREVLRTRSAATTDATTRRLTWALWLLAPVVLALLAARLLVLA